MPKITISEEDLTISNELDVTENIIYIPGIALAEIDDKPKLFRTVKDFVDSYGNSAYKFSHEQIVADKTIVAANEFEKSYMYALELLTAGLPIYFQNIISLKDIIVFVQDIVTSDNLDRTYSLESVTDVSKDNFRNYVTEKPGVGYVYLTEYDETATYYQPKKYEGTTVPTTGVYYILNYEDSNCLSDYYNKLEGDTDNNSIYSDILDRWTYNVKFLTSGGYPTIVNTEQSENYSIFQTMSKAAAVRADTIALIDTPYDESILTSFININENINVEENNPIYTLKGSNKCNLDYTLNNNRKDESILKYATILGPLGVYELYNNSVNLDNNYTIKLPGSFGYLLSLRNNISVLNNPDYLAIAGVTRGLVPHLLSLDNETTGAEADNVQVKSKNYLSVNPIIKVQNYGYCIWGNRTLFPNITSRSHPEGDLAASSFLNIRVMSADVKKIIYAACQDLTFETNNLELWLKFKSKVEPTLEQMVANGALERYELTRLANTEKATLSVYVKLITQYAVEDFDITVGLTDSTVEEAE